VEFPRSWALTWQNFTWRIQGDVPELENWWHNALYLGWWDNLDPFDKELHAPEEITQSYRSGQIGSIRSQYKEHQH